MRYQTVIVVEADGDDRAAAAAKIVKLVRHLGRTVERADLANPKLGGTIMAELDGLDPFGSPGLISFWGGGREMGGSFHPFAEIQDDADDAEIKDLGFRTKHP